MYEVSSLRGGGFWGGLRGWVEYFVNDVFEAWVLGLNVDNVQVAGEFVEYLGEVGGGGGLGEA